MAKLFSKKPAARTPNKYFKGKTESANRDTVTGRQTMGAVKGKRFKTT